jgi:hypothetical protein
MSCEYTQYVPEELRGPDPGIPRESYSFLPSQYNGQLAPRLWRPTDLRGQGFVVVHLDPRNIGDDGTWKDPASGVEFVPGPAPEGDEFSDLTNSAPKVLPSTLYGPNTYERALYFDQRLKQFLTNDGFYGKSLFNINKGKDVLLYAVMKNPYNKIIEYNESCADNPNCGGSGTNPDDPPNLVFQTMQEAFPNWPGTNPYNFNDWPQGSFQSNGRYGALYTAGEDRYSILNNSSGSIGKHWNFSAYYYAYPPGQAFLPGFTDVEFTTKYGENAGSETMRYSSHVGAVLQDSDGDGIPDFIPTGNGARVEIEVGNIMEFKPHMFGTFLRLSPGYSMYPELNLPNRTTYQDHTIFGLIDGSRGEINPINKISQEQYGVNVIPNQSNPDGLYVGPDYEVFELNPTHMGKRIIVDAETAGEEISNFSTLVISEIIMIKATTPDTPDPEYPTAYLIDDEIVQKVEGYLACRYNIQDQLPQRHPYRKFCPGQEPIRSNPSEVGTTPETPIERQGFFPLYLTSSAAKRASPTPGTARNKQEELDGKIGFHTHVINGITYYMPNGLEELGLQYHGNFNQFEQIRFESDFGIDSLDIPKDSKEYRYASVLEDSTLSSSDLNFIQEEGIGELSAIGESFGYAQFYRDSSPLPAGVSRATAPLWNGATPTYPNKFSLFYADGLISDFNSKKPDPLIFELKENVIKVTFNEVDYITSTRSLGTKDNGFKYKVRLSHKLSSKNNFVLEIPRAKTGKTYVGLKVSQNEIFQDEDPSLEPINKSILGTGRIQIMFSEAVYQVADNASEITSFEPVFVIDHINKKIKYLNNLTIANII